MARPLPERHEPGSANQVLVLRQALLGDRFEALAELRHVGAEIVDARERGQRLEAEDPFEERRRPVADRPELVLAAAFGDQPPFDETRDAHLQSPDFFDAERYPELRFESTRVEARGNQLIVDGELTIKGVATPVELRGHYEGAGTDPLGNERIALELSGTIDRTDFGLDWNAPVPGGGLLLPNEVVLTASFAAVRAA